ncbi:MULTISPECIES: cytochrome c [Pseudomonas]|uniref:Cbb3-type cytochrome C oxidase subunit III n=1 Tax=Pseudomonas fluorescens LMG 5329 TaxID=1324332 RepID=A0A0A1YZP5_PSEFL|nr:MULTISPECIES: cytochrome c [Pseudomonas]KGE66276.1 cbb3-type cytochrome C oxidase subunit III [Pseudomonas fluorescens LMG 5329]NWE04457.1 cytochrome c [Pseudomonas sp. IPO3749]NWF24574.1 cytochrome c [Pseudomonas sp. IPO3749]
MPDSPSPIPPSPQEQRELADPHEAYTPIPRSILLLVAVLVLWGIYYIAQAPINIPSELGDGRTVSALEGKKVASGGAADGAALYSANCAACHQATGLGLPGVFPPLEGSEWVLGKPETVVAIVLHGITGQLTVKGNTFNGAMPPFATQLGDAEIAAVLSYVRSQWGNTAPPVSPELVGQVRAATKDKTSPFEGDKELGALKQ